MVAVDLELGRQARGAHAVDQVVELSDARLRGQAAGLDRTVDRVVAEDAEQPPKLGHRLATGRLHGEQ